MNYSVEERRVADKISNGEDLSAREHAIAHRMALNNTRLSDHRNGWNNYRMFGRRNKEI